VSELLTGLCGIVMWYTFVRIYWECLCFFYTRRCFMDLKKLETHVRLCRRNLRSNRVRCCATCPFEEEIVSQYPDLQDLFDKKRERIS